MSPHEIAVRLARTTLAANIQTTLEKKSLVVSSVVLFVPAAAQTILFLAFFDFLPIVGCLQSAHRVGLFSLKLDFPSDQIDGVIHRLTKGHSDIVVIVVARLAVLQYSRQLEFQFKADNVMLFRYLYILF